MGLEYGIIAGFLAEAMLLLYSVARPTVDVEMLKSNKGDLMIVNLCENISYCAVEYVRRKIMKVTFQDSNIPIILNGGKLRKLDFTAASNLMSMIKDLDNTHHIILLNFNDETNKMCVYIDSKFSSRFVYAASPLELPDVFPKEV